MLARTGRFCFRHHRAVALGWLIVFAVGLTAGSQVFGRLGGDGAPGWESVEGYDRLDDVAQYGPRIPAVVDGAAVDDPAVRSVVERASADLVALDGVARVLDPYRAPVPDLRATDGRALAVVVDLDKDLPDGRTDDVADAVESRLHAIAGELPGSKVLVGGNRAINREVNEQTKKDTELGEFVALPVTLVVMVFVFGGLAAAGVPFLGALASIGGALLALLGFSYLLDEMDPSVVSVATVLGLGLSIDYALLMVSRYREERGHGLDPLAAVERTCATAGRTITFSALTVATSLGGLFVFPTPIFRAIGAAGVSVVVIALLAGLTLTPALLGLFGRRIGVPSPVSERRDSDGGGFLRLARAVQRRAVAMVLVVSTLLIAAGLPFLEVRFQNGDADLLPRDFETRQYVDTVKERFPAARSGAPVLVVSEAPLGALQTYAAGLRGRSDIAALGPPEQRGELAVLPVFPVGAAQGDQAQAVVRALRADRPGAGQEASWVTGDAAILVDFKDEVRRWAPLALAVVGLATFVLLFLMTGSVLVPVKALVMNTLSLGASFGALVWIFQDGHLSGLLGFTPTGALETWVPVIVFAFAFGLSMDYEVFLLARIKELRDAGHSNDDAVAIGLQRSGRIITSAALLMVIVFGGFAAGKMLGIKEMGVALALAVLVDATVVRCLLVPATMTLLGERNWWAPAPLRRLHQRIGLHEQPAPDPQRPGELLQR